ncbi:MAG TPA: alpha/beta hydrolase-fold protein [Gemmatales bacterium]|nr:alpha/beta hydrolase-fold protein [Gemmatales bacterium]
MSDPVPSPSRLIHHTSFRSAHLENERQITIYLPPGYEENSTYRYPVIYLHDGQNVFEAHTSAFGIAWDAARTADKLQAAGRLEPVIQVAIYNTPERLFEYAPFADPNVNVNEGRNHAYGEFLFDEVKPFVDRLYRTRPEREHTAIVGSSMGGLSTLGLAWKRHAHFSMAGILSPSLWWSRNRILRELESAESLAWMRTMRFWLDMGNKEGGARAVVPPALQRTRRLVELFDREGLLPGKDYYYWEVAGGEHNETHWAARYDQVLLFFFGKRNYQ